MDGRSSQHGGVGPLVVALHAIGHGGGDFLPGRPTRRALPYLLVDWPGHGESSNGLLSSVQAYAHLLSHLLPQLTDAPAVLLGNSIGGGAALALAAWEPALVRGLVLCDSAGLAPIDRFPRTAIWAMAWFFERGARGAWWFPFAFRRYYDLVLPRARERRRAICNAATDHAAQLARAWRSFAEPSTDLRAFAPSVRAPTWFAWAKSDRVLPWSRSRAPVERFPDRRIERFAGGHSPFLEAPDEFARGFAHFMEEIDRPPGSIHRQADRPARVA